MDRHVRRDGTPLTRGSAEAGRRATMTLQSLARLAGRFGLGPVAAPTERGALVEQIASTLAALSADSSDALFLVEADDDRSTGGEALTVRAVRGCSAALALLAACGDQLHRQLLGADDVLSRARADRDDRAVDVARRDLEEAAGLLQMWLQHGIEVRIRPFDSRPVASEEVGCIGPWTYDERDESDGPAECLGQVRMVSEQTFEEYRAGLPRRLTRDVERALVRRIVEGRGGITRDGRLRPGWHGTTADGRRAEEELARLLLRTAATTVRPYICDDAPWQQLMSVAGESIATEVVTMRVELSGWMGITETVARRIREDLTRDRRRMW